MRRAVLGLNHRVGGPSVEAVSKVCYLNGHEQRYHPVKTSQAEGRRYTRRRDERISSPVDSCFPPIDCERSSNPRLQRFQFASPRASF